MRSGSAPWKHGDRVGYTSDWLPDVMPVRSLCSRMICTACGLIDSDVRPDWSPHTNRRPNWERRRLRESDWLRG